MNRKDYEGHLRDLVYMLPSTYEGNTKTVRDSISKTVPKEIMKNIERIFITGCGDSFHAAHASLPAFKELSGIDRSKISAPRCIELSRNIPLPKENADKTLVIGISATGGSLRTAETLTRAKSRGCVTMSLTSRPESRNAKSADYTFIVGTKDSTDSPGLNSYYCSLYALYVIAALIGEAKGVKEEGTVDIIIEKIKEYTYSYEPILDKIDEDMFELAKVWKDYRGYEAVGDGIGYASAWFVGAKLVECAGMIAPAVDSEQWCHVNTFAHTPENIGTIFQGKKGDANMSRLGETVNHAVGIGRPVLFISDGTKEDFGIKVDAIIYRIPSPPEGYDFLMPLMDYVPGSLLTSYIAAMNNKVYFRRDDERRAEVYKNAVEKPMVVLDNF
ncbi:MAG: SIS domain-containing protein [Ruminococcaceae bacterium]|nr:SIS domain-containing protein [Oscillospiraceae bacterium]